jgi:Ca2+-binding RTX toxin-like protein
MPDIRVQRVGTQFRINGTGPDTADSAVVAREGGGFTAAYDFHDLVSASGAVRARSYTSAGVALDNDFFIRNELGYYGIGLAPAPGGGWILVHAPGGTGVTPPISQIAVFQRSFSSADVETAAGRVNSDSSIQVYPAVAALASGQHVVSWLTTTGEVRAQLFDSADNFVGSQILVTTGATYTSGFNQRLTPPVAGLTGGGFVVAWASGTDILAQRYDATGTATGSQFTVNELTAGTQAEVSVAALPTGGFVPVWTSNAADPANPITSNGDIKGQLFDASGAMVGHEFIIGDAHVNRQYEPRVTMIEAGGFVVTWADNSGTGSTTGFDIKAQVFADDGTPIGSEFQVNAADTNNDGVPAVASLANGDLIFVWIDEGNAASGRPLMGQLFTWVTNYAGTAGDDMLGGSLGNDIFTPGAGVDMVRGFAGHDMVDYSNLTHAMEINLAAGWNWDGTSMDFLREIEDATGSSGNDTLTGTTGDNILDGGPGGIDFINGLAGTDTVSYATATQGVQIYLDQQDGWDGTAMDFLGSMENARGSAFNDYIVGDGGDNVLDGGVGGTDFLIGGGGFDTASYQTSTAAMQIYLDQQKSWDGVTVDFLSSIERGVGSAFNDTLAAAASGSTLDGWVGNDNLFGGAGADTFEFETLGKRMDLGADQIFGFQHGTDKIAIGNDVGFLHAFADIAAHAVQSGSDTLIQINDQSSIRLVGVNLVDLTASDFQFVG